MAATATRSPRLRAFTVDHFAAYTSRLKLDTGEFWEVEDFQLEIVESILDGVVETWAVLPEGNAKTTLLAGVALYHCDYTPAPWVPIAAASRDQAQIMAKQAYGMIRHSPGMLERFRIFEGYREIRSLRNGGVGIKVYAADTDTADGVIPTLCICDEGHRYPNLDLYRLWKGKLGKRHGQIVMVSTAGEPGTDFEETRDAIRDQARERITVGAHTRSAGAGIVMNEWMVGSPPLISDMRAVKEANPLDAITIEDLEDAFNSPTRDLGLWSRLKCNIPARASNAAITDGEWDGAFIPFGIPEGEHIDLGVDAAWKHDTFAITPLWVDPDTRTADEYDQDGRLVPGHQWHILGEPQILTPPGDGSTLPVDVVKVAFEWFLDRYVVDTAVMDLTRAEDVADWLSKKGVTVIDRGQGNPEQVEDHDNFTAGLRGGWLKHTGDAGLRKHVMNAISVPMPGNRRRFDRASTSRGKRKQSVRVIDALTAAGMVNTYAHSQRSETKLAGAVEDYRIERLHHDAGDDYCPRTTLGCARDGFSDDHMLPRGMQPPEK